MTRLRGSLIAAAAVPLFLLSACAQPATNSAVAAPGTPESASAPTVGADELVLRAESYGGFVPADRTVGRLPTVSVYGDGRVITQGPRPAIYPGPALPNIQVQTISPELVQELVREGLTAGVRSGADFGHPNVADAPTTRVTVVTAGGPQSVAVEALGQAQPDDPSLTADQKTARNKLNAYVDKLNGLSGAKGMPAPVPYDAQAVAVLPRPWTDAGSGQPQSATKDWPGPALPGEYLNPTIKIGCVVVTGADKTKVLAAAKDANAITAWNTYGKKWLITFRPLLPDETQGCAGFKSAR